jgi:NAD(P)-dependent dehydrogenase (short-subunit alcohol dehydrogenase family)
MMGALSGKVCLVTGVAQGIGEAIAIAMAEAGASIVGCDVKDDAGSAVIDVIRTRGGQAVYVRCDVGKASEVEQAVKQALSAFGRLDVVVNNAAILPDPARPISEIGNDDWMRVIDINLGSVYRFAHAAIPVMARQGGGVFINLASIHHHKSLPGFSPYAASKGAIVSLTRQLAVECGPQNIRFNTISPGAIATAMTQQILDSDPSGGLEQRFRHMHLLERIGRPEEVAATAVFLASDGAAFITGEDILVDGGIARATRVEI